MILEIKEIIAYVLKNSLKDKLREFNDLFMLWEKFLALKWKAETFRGYLNKKSNWESEFGGVDKDKGFSYLRRRFKIILESTYWGFILK